MSNLRARLMAAMDPQQFFRGTVWGNPVPMSDLLRDIRKSMGESDDGPPTGDLLKQALQNFATTQQVANFTELKYVCYGVTVPLGQTRWRVIDQPLLFDRLLGLVEERSNRPQQFRRCYQGLLDGYFGFDHQSQPSPKGNVNWSRLREYLGQRLAPVLHATTSRGVVPDWLTTLSHHQNLLTEDPCSRYTHELRSGNTDELKALSGALGIASTSWVWDEALMAYVQMVCEQLDVPFVCDMPAVLRLINGEADLRLSQMLAIRATAMTVVRYASSTDHPEHTDLRDASLRWIGNPWVNRTAWDAHAKSEPARQMVEGWLKRYLIKNFFELLAHDGAADLRRLNYWLKWESKITDMWFVLGRDAVDNKSEPFKRLRKLMGDRERFLDDSTSDNNAFVMCIGPLLVIEFGVTNNACFAYAAADFKTSLKRKQLSVHFLKQKGGATKLSHTYGWEPKFDEALRRLLQSVPQSKGVLVSAPPMANFAPLMVAPAPPNTAIARPAQPRSPWSTVDGAAGPVPQPTQAVQVRKQSDTKLDVDSLRTKCVQLGIEWEDNRSKKGAFWVLMPNRNKHPGFVKLLVTLGFSYKAGQGFWIK
jgi:hypothetical protein